MNHSAPTRPLSPEELRSAFDRVLDQHAGSEPPPPAAPAAPAALAGTRPARLRIRALMGLEDREFVDQAYAALLRRRADDLGARHYAGLLAAGASRIAVLGALRYSAEGRAVGTRVPGLRARLLLHRAYRVRGLGRALRTLTAIVALPGLMRDVAALANGLRALRLQSEAATRAIEREMRSRADFTEQSLERAAARERQVTRDHAERLDALAGRLGEEPWAEPLLTLAERGEAQGERLDRLAAALDALTVRTSGLFALDEALAGIDGADGPDPLAARPLRFGADLREQRNLAARAIDIAEDSRAALREQERRLSLLLGEVRGWMAHGLDAQAPARVAAAQDHLLDPLYLAFEDRFRGSRADIKQRQSVYLDLLREAGAGTPERPIVDVGSGRGELLELLGENAMQARGVDLNAAMVELCINAGLACDQGDAIAALSALQPGSLGAVTGFHIIEHLPFTAMVALFDASLRALAPGGVVIFETPNPANLIVASRWFHLDPTHRNPLPGEMVAMIAEARGFVQVSIRELHPMARRFEARDEVLAGQLDAIFHGPQDYAVIARKA